MYISEGDTKELTNEQLKEVIDDCIDILISRSKSI